MIFVRYLVLDFSRKCTALLVGMMALAIMVVILDLSRVSLMVSAQQILYACLMRLGDICVLTLPFAIYFAWVWTGSSLVSQQGRWLFEQVGLSMRRCVFWVVLTSAVVLGIGQCLAYVSVKSQPWAQQRMVVAMTRHLMQWPVRTMIALPHGQQWLIWHRDHQGLGRVFWFKSPVFHGDKPPDMAWTDARSVRVDKTGSVRLNDGRVYAVDWSKESSYYIEFKKFMASWFGRSWHASTYVSHYALPSVTATRVERWQFDWFIMPWVLSLWGWVIGIMSDQLPKQCMQAIVVWLGYGACLAGSHLFVLASWYALLPHALVALLAWCFMRRYA